MDKRLFLLDAYALIFRAYYALIRNPRFTSKGRNTNAQFGFTNTLIDLINKERPTHLAVCVEGFEADDVIGTLAWQANDAGYDVYMVTPDKDFGQLVRNGIKIYKPGYQGGTPEILGPKEVCAKWDIDRVDQVERKS